nr:hypothetical protein GCM10020093_031430 [Planobispora longispora]
MELEDGYVDKEGQLHTALTLRLPTGADEEAVAPQLRENPSLGKNALLARCIKSLGDVPRHRLDALGSRILADLTMTDRRLIDRAMAQAAPGSTWSARSSARPAGRRSPPRSTCPIFSAGVDLDGLRREIFFLAYHLHWSWGELMDLDIAERRVYVSLLIEQIERENSRMEEAR